jgi:hypothetical protein
MFSKITLMIGFMLLSTGALQAQDKPELEIGGAVRFNYNLSSWKEGQKKRGGDFDICVSMQKPRNKGIKLIQKVLEAEC